MYAASSRYVARKLILYFAVYDLAAVTIACQPSIKDFRNANVAKVHKIENFFGFDFEFCTISLVVMHKYQDCGNKILDWTNMEGAPIVPHSLETKGNKKNFKIGQFKIKSFMNPLHLLKIVLSKFNPLTATGMALCVNIGAKCQNLFSLV